MASYKRNKLKDGFSWRALVNLKGVRDSQTFDTKAEAVGWADAREAEIMDGINGLERRTVRQAIERFREFETPKRRGARWDSVRLTKFLRDLPFVDRQLAEVRPADIAAWREKRMTEVAPGSVRREMNLMRSVLEVCRAEWGWLRSNPMDDVKKPSDPPHRERVISDSERDAILKAFGYAVGQRPSLNRHRVAMGFLFALETAMRAGEVFGLGWGRVYLAERFVRLVDTKNGHPRDVPLSKAAVAILESMPEREGGVFRVSKSVAEAMFRQNREKAKLSGFRFHDARGTACTRLAQKLHIMDLARVTGHRDPRHLMRYYRPKASDIAARMD